MKTLGLLLVMTSLSPAAVHYVIVAGLGGEPDYEQRFTGLAKELDKLLTSAPDAGQVRTLYGSEATRANVELALEAVAGKAAADDVLVLTLIGHGSFDGHEYKLNLPGLDLTAIELAAFCDRVKAGRQLVVNATSASGGSLIAFQRPNRAVITATKSGTEKNATVFARYWVEALRDPACDTDKNQVISALEAFRFAAKKTGSFYETQKRLATEHALLEDTGQGEGVREPSPENGQGLLAGRFPLVRMGEAHKAAADPAKRKLLERKEELEQQIDRLKYEKAALPLNEYQTKLAALLLELAKTQEELER